ncbi:hypothetical protein TSOC_010994 [Tetrabaena socialis]|uniref:Uncharacterized protein n=1 Tax=Tetrabaena socialis TaxID=47790 RepID=A0A2J7ZRU2_9CHLO|nr:hypothetical protein TSOC_010994 [Tetrabaena socialis]|eukprot:PNH02978.1 hypothetical protein TSOC_010994 [Tetrabaena socialis]
MDFAKFKTALQKSNECLDKWILLQESADRLLANAGNILQRLPRAVAPLVLPPSGLPLGGDGGGVHGGMAYVSGVLDRAHSAASSSAATSGRQQHTRGSGEDAGGGPDSMYGTPSRKLLTSQKSFAKHSAVLGWVAAAEDGGGGGGGGGAAASSVGSDIDGDSGYGGGGGPRSGVARLHSLQSLLAGGGQLTCDAVVAFTEGDTSTGAGMEQRRNHRRLTGAGGGAAEGRGGARPSVLARGISGVSGSSAAAARDGAEGRDEGRPYSSGNGGAGPATDGDDGRRSPRSPRQLRGGGGGIATPLPSPGPSGASGPLGSPSAAAAVAGGGGDPGAPGPRLLSRIGSKMGIGGRRVAVVTPRALGSGGGGGSREEEAEAGAPAEADGLGGGRSP